MFKGLGDLTSLFKQARAMQGHLQEAQIRLRSERVQGTAGGGLVSVEANGLGEILKVSIESGLVEKGERELIEDLLPDAINQAVSKAKELHLREMRTATNGLNLPGLDGALSQLMGGGPPGEEG